MSDQGTKSLVSQNQLFSSIPKQQMRNNTIVANTFFYVVNVGDAFFTTRFAGCADRYRKILSLLCQEKSLLFPESSIIFIYPRMLLICVSVLQLALGYGFQMVSIRRLSICFGTLEQSVS